MPGQPTIRRIRLPVAVAIGTVLVGAAAAIGWWRYRSLDPVAEAERAVASQDFARSVDLLSPYLLRHPDDLRGQFLYAQTLRRLKRPAEAQKALLRAMQLGLSEAEGRREFALAEALKGFGNNAERNLLDVLAERPDDGEVLQALAEGYASSRRWEEADRAYTRWHEREPHRLEVRLERGRMRLRAAQHLAGRLADAAADFREVLRRAPDHYEARLNLAHCLLSDANMAEARAELLICRRLRSDRIEPLVGLAACALEERDWAESETLLKEALELDASSAYAWVMLGDLYLRQQEFRKAIPTYSRALELAPRDKGAHLKLAQALRGDGQEEQAREQERIYQQLLGEGMQRSGAGPP